MPISNNSLCLLPPREENVFRGARQFMHRWDFFKTREAPSARGVMRTQAKASAGGNINIAGVNRSSLSMIFLPSQDGFFDAIEPGVRDLVRFFAVESDLITYTSCEGHWYRERNQADERHVGILLRTPTEKANLWNGIDWTAQIWDKKFAHLPIALAIMEGTVRDYHLQLPTLDFYLSKRAEAGWDIYFSSLNFASEQLAHILRSGRQSGPFRLGMGTKYL